MPEPRTSKKLIEVALPLEAINKASAREKSIRHGHPSTLHLWWARRPLAACRAVLFGQLVDDPLSWPDRFPTAQAQEEERKRLFDVIEQLVKWENSNNEHVLNVARFEIARSLAWNRGEEPPAKSNPNAVLAYLQEHAPPVYDPFCGGGSIPLEAQRLGLRAYGSDLNPVAVLISKALVEIPPKFAGRPPVNPARDPHKRWKGAQGLAEDVRHYGQWMRAEAEKRIGHLYPQVEVTEQAVREQPSLEPLKGQKLTVIAWLWARTVASPNPAANRANVPLVSSFMLSTKEGKKAWVEPVIDASAPDGYRLVVRSGRIAKEDEAKAKAGTKVGRGSNFTCVLTNTPLTPEHIKAEGKAGRMSARLLAIVAQGIRGRIYLSPTEEHEQIARSAEPEWEPEGDVPERLTGGTCYGYGLTTWGKLFTRRQLVAMTTFSDLVSEAREKVLDDARTAFAREWQGAMNALHRSGYHVMAYGPTKLGLEAIVQPAAEAAPLSDRLRNLGFPSVEQVAELTSDHTATTAIEELETAIIDDFLDAASTAAGAMGASGPNASQERPAYRLRILDRRLAHGGISVTAYAEAVATYLAFAVSKCSTRSCSLAIWEAGMGRLAGAMGRQAIPMQWSFAETNPLAGAGGDIAGTAVSVAENLDNLGIGLIGNARQSAAQTKPRRPVGAVISTDPPYYDNIAYADLSDFFYVWLRRSIGRVWPDLFHTLLVPKAEELVATPYRHGGRDAAEEFFMDGMTRALHNLAGETPGEYPLAIYYAFKQSEAETEGIASTGWATFLQAMVEAGLVVDGTWPVRTEATNALKAKTNALASSIVLVCRKRPKTAQITTRAEFLKAIKRELPDNLKLLQHGNIAPVDLAQASVGPGMAIFTRYAKVLEADDSPMPVKSALQLINTALDEFLSEQEGEYDPDTRFAITWFETHGMEPAAYGTAETLATARNVSVAGVAEAGLIEARGGKVRLLSRTEIPADWDPATDRRLTVWEATQHLIRRLELDGEQAAADLLNQLDSRAEPARDLAYRLYQVCERNKWADEGRAYNGLVIAWPELVKLARAAPEDLLI